MKSQRLFAGIGCAALAVLSFAALKGTALDSFVSTLHQADGLDVTYSLTTVGGASENVTVKLAKPNKARIETANKVVVADGSKITTYMKDMNSYYVKDQNATELRGLFNEAGLDTWLGFFDDKALTGLASTKDAGTKKRRGTEFKVVEAKADAKGETAMTYYIDPNDMMAKSIEIVSNFAGRSETTIMSTNSIALKAPGEGAFAFKAPNGAKEIDEIDMVAGKWYTDFEEAQKVAQATGKLMMVDFYATWCVPCKMMAAEAFTAKPFKEASKNMILVKIDAEIRTDLAQRYGIEAYPTVKFINGKGDLVHEYVGYGGIQHVVGEVNTAAQKHGK
ncbi:MAG: thioredoxin family protein [Armatimonadetes bacterium]|nr:thioredoxin family protein [Armatimonadota bacterium]